MARASPRDLRPAITNRRLQLNWNPTRSLWLWPSTPVPMHRGRRAPRAGRQLQPDAWRAWRTCRAEYPVREAPVHYAQQASLSYQLPHCRQPSSSSAHSSYSSAYSWDCGDMAVLRSDIRLCTTSMAQGAPRVHHAAPACQLRSHPRTRSAGAASARLVTRDHQRRAREEIEGRDCGNELIDRLYAR